MRHGVTIRLNDVEMKQLKTLSKAFGVDDKRAIKECVSSAFYIYVKSLKEAAAAAKQAKESSSEHTVDPVQLQQGLG